ncbi:uncharacterized protein LOC118438460 isoform X2 [Folsomia candida]|uniref:uncharacterized protein LOC118438460 isoform X2 n=1 Tax=Folsomia candida TaxID=158441 RepID=UPI001604E7A9|nr:uncharacterized protein LOC118438460 isoform X2 [Folsomia candida]
MSDARIIVGGNGPQCYIAEMLRGGVLHTRSGPGRIVASGQYIVQKAKAELSKVGNVPAGCISRIHAWGWPGETGAYIEVKDAVLKGAEIAVRGPGVEIPLVEVATNSDYIFTKFSKEFLRLQV